MTTPSTTSLQISSIDQPLEDVKSPDIGMLLILYFHMITELIHNNFHFIIFQHVKENVYFKPYYLILFSYLTTFLISTKKLYLTFLFF